MRDSTRSLISDRYSVITLPDDTRRVQHFLTFGMSAEEAEQP